MTDFDYKKYSLENLEKWMSDALLSSEATPQEIYDVIRGVVDEEYHYFKHQTGRCYELLALLNGHGQSYEDVITEKEYYESSMTEEELSKYKVLLSCDKDDQSPECQKSWNDFWEDVDEKHSREYNLREAEYYNQRVQLDAKQDKVVKWQLPVEVDGLTGDCIVQFPDDLLEAANLKEGDKVEWVDQGDGSYLLKKV